VVGLLVRLVGLEPSASITYTSRLPSRPEWKAMRVPSGDQAGKPSVVGLLVRLVGLEPSASITYTSQ